MRSKNWTIMMGRVKLKSKSAAFSISAASEGGAKDKEVSVKREMDLRVGICWVFKSFGVGIFGRESCGIFWSLGFEGEEEATMVITGFEEAIIMLAMASVWSLMK
ncbi:hypothetical protein F3Y22_tig00110540pilonHSYRG00058 [Hibiscus syriacus]|uniref:Uncharacterized protein n=1 Tax=Hibiscus syriacus TaxID=106335 RepID=A0A6A3AAW0_HIBSY|nr:hypothetical protein F3Y22_tig00110540pilonHSYRG00058 [Hibiscus syriacus]